MDEVECGCPLVDSATSLRPPNIFGNEKPIDNSYISGNTEEVSRREILIEQIENGVHLASISSLRHDGVRANIDVSDSEGWYLQPLIVTSVGLLEPSLPSYRQNGLSPNKFLEVQ